MRKLCILVACAALFFAGVSAVYAKAAVPAGYPGFCLEKPQFCAQDRVKIKDTSPHKKSPEALTILQKVNTKWNRAGNRSSYLEKGRLCNGQPAKRESPIYMDFQSIPVTTLQKHPSGAFFFAHMFALLTPTHLHGKTARTWKKG